MKTPTRIQTRSTDNVVSSLLVPVQNKSLLIPNIVIAEVVSQQDMEPATDVPPWCLGYTIWRGERIPVLSFEIANSQVKGRDSTEARVAILNAVSGQARQKFFAILVQGIPRMIKLTDNEIREDKQTTTSQAEKMAVVTQLGKAVIPDLDYLESLVARLHA